MALDHVSAGRRERTQLEAPQLEAVIEHRSVEPRSPGGRVWERSQAWARGERRSWIGDLAEPRGEARDRRRVKDVANGQIGTEQRADPAHQPHGRHRVT